MVESDQNKEQLPCRCKNCEANLEEPGMVIMYEDLPTKMVGHLETGKDGSVNFVAEMLSDASKPTILCGECGADISDLFTIDDVYLEEMYEDEDAELHETESL